LEYWNSSGRIVAEREAALQAAVVDISQGKTVAVKGLGGFHLMVAARDDEAVRTLRRRKHREEKPLALMYSDIGAVRRDCIVSAEEELLLRSPEAPIVLLERREHIGIAEAVAGPIASLGVMLPYTPLHYLLMADVGFPVVATSGNLSDEPICTDEQEALARLSGIADAFLVHDRPIVRHVDDAVVRVVAGRPMVLRRARGYAPFPVAMPNGKSEAPVILAVGAHLKNALAVAGKSGISMSQHIGDLDTVEAHKAFVRVANDLTRLLDSPSERIACDLHPDYHSTIWARRQGLPTLGVQHHHAHIAACMVDNDLDGDVLGVAWDGTGYGEDGTVWGGEFLACSRDRFNRIGHLRMFPLPGGDAAVKEPRRSALGVLFELFGDEVFSCKSDLAPLSAFAATERTALQKILHGGINVYRTSSAGRLFDVVASILNLRQIARFEGQAAMLVEYAATKTATDAPYGYRIQTAEDAASPRVLDWEPMILEILEDRKQNIPVAEIAAKFHNTLAAAIADMASRHAEETGQTRVVLSGGCFQNKLLLEKSILALRDAGLSPFWHQRIPPNDGGISAGQAAVARAQWDIELEADSVSGNSR
jgi:hydrogenase maturation protein HypF